MKTTSRIKTPTLQERASGVLLHPTSLPGPYAIGDLGPSAYSFVDFLAASGQRWWQLLPISPIGAGNSPYQSFSSFAGNTLLISPEQLAREGWLESNYLPSLRRLDSDQVDYEIAREVKRLCLWRAFERFEMASKSGVRRAFDRFCQEQKAWLEDYALFSALRFHHQGEEWSRWEKDLRTRRSKAMAAARRDFAHDIRYHQFVQWQFVHQWQSLRRYAAERGVGLIGDIPIFVSPNSSDVWSRQDLFKLRSDGSLPVVAGVPPDYFSKTGQRWGNPLYRWDMHRKQGYRWWVERLRQTFHYFDVVRIDHFIGFVRYYEVPGESPTAEQGQYRPGPGADFLKAVFRQLGPVQFVAEDLGTVTPEVKKLRDQFNLPGMKVLQFAFGKDPEARAYQPHRYPTNAVVYTGTHDNDTTVGWFQDMSTASTTRSRDDIDEERSNTLQYLSSNGREIHWDMIRAALMSVANTAIVPMQDLLGLGSVARMNRPGVPEGNWEWRMRPAALTPDLARRLREMTELYERF